MPPFFLSIEDHATGQTALREVQLPSVDFVLAEMDRIEREALQRPEGARFVSVTARNHAGQTLTRHKLRIGAYRTD